MTTPLDNFVCGTCGHVAVRHLMHRGPCAGCWTELLEICKHFLLKDEDVATVAALDLG